MCYSSRGTEMDIIKNQLRNMVQKISKQIQIWNERGLNTLVMFKLYLSITKDSRQKWWTQPGKWEYLKFKEKKINNRATREERINASG